MDGELNLFKLNENNQLIQGLNYKIGYNQLESKQVLL